MVEILTLENTFFLLSQLLITCGVKRDQTRTPQDNADAVKQMNKTTTTSMLKVLNTFFLHCILSIIAFINQIQLYIHVAIKPADVWKKYSSVYLITLFKCKNSL